MNVLNRQTNDIELVDYIEPARPQGIYNYDLFQPTYERVASMPPSYHTVDRWYISSWSEYAINLEYILIIFVCFLILIIILKLKFSNTNSRIIFTNGISSQEITYTSDYQELLSVRLGNDAGYFVTYGKPFCHILPPYWSIFNIKDWLELLEEQDYAVTIELISKDKVGLFPNNPRVILTREFIVNNYSNPIIISSLISSQIANIYEMFNINDEVDHYILIHYRLLMPTK